MMWLPTDRHDVGRLDVPETVGDASAVSPIAASESGRDRWRSGARSRGTCSVVEGDRAGHEGRTAAGVAERSAVNITASP